MKVLKWILIILAAIVAIFLIYSASQPNKAITQQSIEINAPAETVYQTLIDFPSWSNWSAWAKKDTNMTSEYSETFGEIGSFSAWESKNPEVGTGKQEIVELRPNEYLKMEMNFTDWPGTKYAEFILEEKDGITSLTWTYEGSETPFYLNFMNPIISAMLEQDYNTSLKNLKEYIESFPPKVENPMNLEVLEVEADEIISILDSTDANGISAKLQELYTELSIYLELNEGISQEGMPLSIYHSYSPEKVVLEAAIPYAGGEAKSSGRIVAKKTPAGKVVKGVHYGDYATSGNMHNAIEQFMKASELSAMGACWEVYANDPQEVDSAAVETIIYYPIQ